MIIDALRRTVEAVMLSLLPAGCLCIALGTVGVLSTTHGTCQLQVDGNEASRTPQENVLRVPAAETSGAMTADTTGLSGEHISLTAVDSLLEQPTYDNLWSVGRRLALLAVDRVSAGLFMDTRQKQDYTKRWNSLCRIVSDSVMADTTERFLEMLRGTYQGLYNSSGIVPVLDIDPREHGLDTTFVYSVNALYTRLNDVTYGAYESLRRERLPQVEVNPPQDTTLTQLGRCLHAYAGAAGLMLGIATTYYPLQVDVLTGLWNVTGNLFDFCRDQNSEGFMLYFLPDSTQK